LGQEYGQSRAWQFDPLNATAQIIKFSVSLEPPEADQSKRIRTHRELTIHRAEILHGVKLPRQLSAICIELAKSAKIIGDLYQADFSYEFLQSTVFGTNQPIN
jgi:hypothetical protein